MGLSSSSLNPVNLTLAVWACLAFGGGCVIDKTGMSRSVTLQQDLVRTQTQVHAIQSQVDNQLSVARARVEEVEERVMLSRTNVANSEAQLTTLLREVQALRGVYEEAGRMLQGNDKALERFHGDFEFRLAQLEKRLTVVERQLAGVPTLASGEGGDPGVAAVLPDVGSEGSLGAEETLVRAKKYFEAGDYRAVCAFLKEFQTRYPKDPSREEAQFLLAESLFRDGDTVAAIQAFQAVLEQFPGSDRIPIVLLRQGEAFLALGELDDARLFLEELVRAFPDSEQAKLAQAHLDRIE